MKNIFFAAAIIIYATACQRAILPAATIITNTEITNANGQPILAGRATPSAMQMPNYKDWYNQSYNSYTIDSTTAHQLMPLMKNKTMEIFLGSWCGDSRREVPRMLKILQHAGVDTNSVHIVFVDNSPTTYKQSPQHEEQGKYIHRVPTFIVYKGNKEIGRVVESPVVSLEKDLQAILTTQSYVPNYKAANWWRLQEKGRKEIVSEETLQSMAIQIKPLIGSNFELSSFANVLFTAGRQTEAINVYRLNSVVYPGDHTILNSLGDALVQANRKTEAIAVFEKMLVLQPGDEVLRKKIAALKM